MFCHVKNSKVILGDWFLVCYYLEIVCLTLNPLTWRIWSALNNARKWQMGFNSAFNPLNTELNPICQ